MASPRAKNSNKASKMTRAMPIATIAVEPHSTRPTTHGIRTTAVATRFQVIAMGSPYESLTPSHHIKGNKSRGRIAKKRSVASGEESSLAHDARGVLRGSLTFAYPAVAALAFLVFEERLEQTCAVEIGPQRFRHENLRVGDLPQQKIAYAHLAAGADEQIGVRQSTRVHVPCEGLFRDRRAVRMPVLLGQNRVHGVHNFRAAAIVQRHAKHHALVPCRSFHRVANIVLHAFRQFVRAAQKSHADIVFLQERHFLTQILAQQLHEEVYFRFRAAPVFDGKRVQGKRVNLQPRAGLYGGTRRFSSGSMAGNARQVPLLRPPPVAIHDYGHVPRQATQIKFSEKKRLLGRQRSQRAGGGNLQRLGGVSRRHGIPSVSSLRRKVSTRFGRGAMPCCRLVHHLPELSRAWRQRPGGGAVWNSEV